MAKPRVAFILPGTSTGGMEMFTLRLVRSLRTEVQPVIIVRSDSPGELDAAFREAGCEVFYRRLGYIDPLAAWRFRLFLGRLELASICDLTGAYAGQILFLAWVAGIPRRVAFHRRSDPEEGRSYLAAQYAAGSLRLTERFATSILSNSHQALATFHPRLVGRDRRLEVVRNMIDPGALRPSRMTAEVRSELGIPEEARVLLHVGRLDPAKDHETLLVAAKTVVDRFPDVHLILAGSGTEKLKEVGSSPLSGHPRFHALGNRTDVPDLLSIASVFVFPSVSEGSPNALLEAMIAGVRIVASDIPSHREVIPEAAWGRLTPPRDGGALAEAIIQALQTGSDRELVQTWQPHAIALTKPEKIRRRLLELLIGPNVDDRQRV